MCFLIQSEKKRYGELLEHLNKGSYKGRDEFPDTVTGAYELLIRTSIYIRISTCQINRFSSRTKYCGRFSFIFAQNGRRENLRKHKYQGNTVALRDVLKGGDGVTQYEIKCYGCQTLGHYNYQCPDQIGENFAHIGIIFSQVQHRIKNIWLFFTHDRQAVCQIIQ